MSETLSSREVFLELLAGITAGRFAELAELYAEDAVVETVFQPVGPRRLEGRAVLRARFAEVAAHSPLDLTARNVVVRETDDPEVVVAEWDYQVHHRESGRAFEAANIQVLRVRDGLIVHSRDYHDHLALATAGGNLPQLVAALEGE
ncbi:nuclear transport factor 2 family protein [Kitasatospora sp. NBC_00240]|uniref:nuclear transport factor 2 family protein n=1 Tax=Kitasatospora sp. NBC_00240 TaxID=2903567 RepID=UPI00225537E7|nr:nuclear transport factor 2 family protein [Kitasatospora sp. NBC_00240]MCX5207741.1 nuclear transport factor 2 family protein [Kitasatospora sp. NBC_00240]MCX5215360.1 nuclear transport factor 2 family protein [Kitasatospora sp. NBC_00240]MCX5216079.1 nuclear transport factor 2 family protein [Kitasatospora sp. NBC_00240]